jgi:hypothetical protein
MKLFADNLKTKCDYESNLIPILCDYAGIHTIKGSYELRLRYQYQLYTLYLKICPFLYFFFKRNTSLLL